MPLSAGRRSAVLLALLATLLVVAVFPVSAAGNEPPGINRFMNAIGEVESGGRYDARNKSSGAYGKYQIMPSNWPGWAKRYLGDANAKQSPQNQERVARGKFIDLWKWLGAWPTVAHWWLTGSSERDPSKWSAYSSKYVAKVMKLMRTASDKAPQPGGPNQPTPPLPTPPPPAPPAPALLVYQDTSNALALSGTWSAASYRGYAGGTVRYATQRGATATLAFTGRSVSWIGPVGPTRGRARVFVDGVLTATIDLRASGFSPRRTIFSTTWPTSGAHTLTIRVLRAPGRPVVAIDELRVAG